MNAVVKRLRDAGVEVHLRHQWGSPQQAAGAYKRRRRTHPMTGEKARYHFLHITVTADTDTVKEGAAGMQQVETYGYSTPPMVSYHWCTTNEGRVFEGQNMGVKGTHTINDKGVTKYPHDLNAYGHAVALLQNVGDAVTDAQVHVTAWAMAAMELEGETVIGAPVLPHRMFAAKSCPGDKAMARLEEIEALKNEYVRDALRSSDADLIAAVVEARRATNAAVVALHGARKATNIAVTEARKVGRNKMATNLAKRRKWLNQTAKATARRRKWLKGRAQWLRGQK